MTEVQERPAASSWNLFACELEAILQDRKLRLGHLDDRAGIHREKVRRLRLRDPGCLFVLNPTELEQVVEAFQLTAEEELRLHAAILVTTIERTLLKRGIPPEEVLRVAQGLFPIILAALKSSRVGALRHSPFDVAEEPGVDEMLGEALAAIDQATLALHLSYDSEAPRERQEQLRQAEEGFRAALEELEALSAEHRVSETWQFWRDEAERGLESVAARRHDWGM